MANIHEDSDWDVAEPTGQPRWIQPFPESNAKILFEQDYTQRINTWHSENVQLGAPHPTLAGFYLVQEPAPKDLGGGMGMITRTYSQVPPARTSYESFAFTFPGIETGALYTVNAVAGNTATTTNGVTTLSISGGTAIAEGDTCRIKYNAFSQTEQFTRFVIRTALPGTTGSTLKVKQIVDTLQAQPLYFWFAQKIEIGRSPITKTVASIITFEYFLPGVSSGVDTFSDIPLSVKDVILDNEGLATDTYSNTTSPSIIDYRQQVADGDLIVAEDSIVRPWFGPILEKSTRYVKAQ